MGKLGLGTVQLGMPYGIANRRGQPTRTSALAIIKEAADAGIDCFDTAGSYGESEELLGTFFLDFPEYTCRISTKIGTFDDGTFELAERQIQNQLNKSVQRLGRPIDYLLFHHASEFIRYSDCIAKTLRPYQENGQIKKVGVSVYSPEEAVTAMETYPIDVIQMPVNVFDHRHITLEMQRKFAENNVELHARSVYLQGLLCMQEQLVPAELSHSLPYIRQFHEICREYHLPQEHTAFVYVRDLEMIDRYFVGCESLEQLRKNIRYLSVSPLPASMRQELDTMFMEVPDEVIKPFMWRL